MAMEGPIGACGMLCRTCAAYKATQTTDPEELKALAAIESQWLGAEVKPEENHCDGCMTMGGRKGPCVPRCTVRPCAVSHGYQTCAECDQFACEKLAAYLKDNPEARAVLAGLRAR